MSGETSQASRKWLGPFFTIWGGQAVSLLGSQLVQFALVWWLTKQTGSATVLATATLVAMLPQVFIGPIAGALVDRWNRRVVMIVADGLTALGVLALAGLFWMGWAQVWHIYLLMFFRAVTGIFHWTAMQASTSMLVPKEHLSRVQGLNQMLNGMMNIGAAPLGALLMGLLPMQGVLMIDVSTAAIAILPLFFIAIPQPPRSQPEENPAAPSLRRELAAGFKYVWAWPGLLAIMFMATVINLLLTPVSSLQPILVTNYFKGEAFHLAWMEAAWGIGVVMGGLVLSAWGGFRRRVLTSMLGIVLLGVSVLGVGLVPANMFPLAVVLMFVVGFSNPITNGPLFAILQAIVAPDMQGRVFTLIGSVATAATPLGLLAAGPLADQFGVRVWYGVAGVITLLLAAGALLTPLIMNVEERPAPVSASPEPAAAPAD